MLCRFSMCRLNEKLIPLLVSLFNEKNIYQFTPFEHISLISFNLKPPNQPTHHDNPQTPNELSSSLPRLLCNCNHSSQCPFVPPRIATLFRLEIHTKILYFPSIFSCVKPIQACRFPTFGCVKLRVIENFLTILDYTSPPISIPND